MTDHSKRRPEVLIVVEGGIADHVPGPDDADVTIIDFDTDGADAEDLEGMIDQYNELPSWMQDALADQMKRVRGSLAWIAPNSEKL